MPSTWETFGNAVATARTARTMTRADLALAVFGNPGRSPYIARIELGRTELQADTVGKLALALALPDPALTDLPPEDLVTPEDRTAQDLLPQNSPLSEALLTTLANDFARASHADLTTARSGLNAALAAAAELHAIGQMAPAIPDPVFALTRHVADLNDLGLCDQAGAQIDEALTVLDASQTLLKSALTEIALRQDRIRNAPDATAKRLLVQLRATAHPGGVFKALHDLWEVWFDRGTDTGVIFDLTVALHLARANLARSKAVQRSQALVDLGITQFQLGEREGRAARLTQSIATFRTFLTEHPRKRDPESWAVAKVNLGIALKSLGQREADTARLTEAVTAFRAALEVQTPAAAPQDWATTTGHLTEAQSILANWDVEGMP